MTHTSNPPVPRSPHGKIASENPGGRDFPEKSAAPNVWAIVPAAGIGRRMGSDKPKQYLALDGVPILTRTIARLANHPAIRGVIVAIADNDVWWPALGLTSADAPPGAQVHPAPGGAERRHSVRNALATARDPRIGAREEDWVLVHDAVRPCLRHSDVTGLIAALSDHPVGGLLGVRVRDTMKRTGKEGGVTETVEREGLWHALTPQMFRLGALFQALEGCIRRGVPVTDETQAMELWAKASGAPMPRMVEGADDNVKITRPGDLALAAFYLQRQAESATVERE